MISHDILTPVITSSLVYLCPPLPLAPQALQAGNLCSFPKVRNRPQEPLGLTSKPHTYNHTQIHIETVTTSLPKNRCEQPVDSTKRLMKNVHPVQNLTRH